MKNCKCSLWSVNIRKRRQEYKKWVYRVKICKPKNHNWLQCKKDKGNERYCWINTTMKNYLDQLMWKSKKKRWNVLCECKWMSNMLIFLLLQVKRYRKRNIWKEMKVSIGIKIYIRMTYSDYTKDYQSFI